MASRRDLFQSYQFMIQRLVSSLVLRESDPLQTPMRRLAGSAFGGVMLAILALAVAGVIGVVKPGGNKTWKDESAVIVESETGARFVWMPNQQGEYQLHPVPNLGSGALLAGTNEVVEVSRNSLKDVPRGKGLGIIGTADSIPDAGSMLGIPWTLCSLPAENRSGVLVPNTALVLGREKSRGQALADHAVLVRDIEANELYMVWNSRRFRIPDEKLAITALGLPNATQVRVGTAWLTSLPAGKDLAPVIPAGAGSPSSAVPGRTNGAVIVTATAKGDQHYVVTATGLMPITGLQAALTMQHSGVAARVEAQQIAGITVLPAPAPDPADLPSVLPELAEPRSEDSTLCAQFGKNPSAPGIWLEAGVEGAEKAPASDRRTQDGNVLADRVVLRGGHGAIVESLASPTDKSGVLFLITDEGKRYAIPDRDILQTLGYGDVKPIRMPASLVDRIQQGAALDPDLAKHEL